MKKIAGTDLGIHPVIFLYPPWSHPKSKQFNSNIFHQLSLGLLYFLLHFFQQTFQNKVLLLQLPQSQEAETQKD